MPERTVTRFKNVDLTTAPLVLECKRGGSVTMEINRNSGRPRPCIEECSKCTDPEFKTLTSPRFTEARFEVVCGTTVQEDL